MPAGVTDISAVQLNAVLVKTGSIDRTTKLYITDGSNTKESPNLPLAYNGASAKHELITTDLLNGTWSEADVNALRLGVDVS